ncbi:MAG TPA: hypothetical protein VHO25_22070 [Polyangiaceae bacterium]|nr:hypothetical protein [Polyangiaceae bacterium]
MRPAWIDDAQRRETVVQECEPNDKGWTVKDGDGWSLSVPNDICDQRPQPGETFLQFGKGIGFTVRGIVIGGRTYRYNTAEEEDQRHKDWCREQDEKRQQQLDETKTDRDARIAALPEPLRLRLERFQRVNPDFRRDHEPYELFCCEEAAKLYAALPTREQITAFKQLSVDEQKQAVPALSLNEHRGNTFGATCMLAAMLCERPDLVPRAHGALCPLVGCEDYGCFAGHEGKTAE